MTVKELRQRFDNEGVRPSAYDLEGMGTDEAYCLERVGTKWVVYYRERDLHRDERAFTSEHAACSFLLERVLKDPTTRSSFSSVGEDSTRKVKRGGGHQDERSDDEERSEAEQEE